MAENNPPLIVHVIHRLAVGGLENGLVNLINRTPEGRYRHAILALEGVDPDFRARIERPVEVHDLAKRPGQDLGLYLRMWRALRRLRPAIVHTRNLATLEMQLPARLAGVAHRVHGEHGRDVHDLDNTRRRYRWLRRAFRPLVEAYIPLSRELAEYLRVDIGVAPERIHTIRNGVDEQRFRPARPDEEPRAVLPAGFAGPDDLVIGTVGRLEPVKDQATLVRAFIALVREDPARGARLRLVLIGDGSQRTRLGALVDAAGLGAQVWFAGSRDDVPACLRALDLFVLPSLGEGISNTILEAMASGLAVVATEVGGNGELVVAGETGALVPRDDTQALAAALRGYLADPALARTQGAAARSRIEAEFGLGTMVARYLEVYDGLLAGPGE
ncbi:MULTISPECIES: TIGR03088 family PEP-CTERM/XrtA system glycosyltransferase [unclassified Marichromatium]|uniref:TIGR03088 family PEP-CTERM/XrtA system glycosyltransferase n=1 Tax=unclassified Marichromatium TaxID=2618417 RepID=UPI000F3D2790|nr:TIGR03088 family PEP-CTERM/XrtA system glycosyltransferase [Marichromatium sp. AB32]RNE93469.1 TIGR03088 family PEP-CTERM/XrtA system glycosyltransferase [Marichromatium sp. AB32]